MCRASGAGHFMHAPALTRWANAWRTYGAHNCSVCGSVVAPWLKSLYGKASRRTPKLSRKFFDGIAAANHSALQNAAQHATSSP
jgi:hypothetical protein